MFMGTKFEYEDLKRIKHKQSTA